MAGSKNSDNRISQRQSDGLSLQLIQLQSRNPVSAQYQHSKPISSGWFVLLMMGLCRWIYAISHTLSVWNLRLLRWILRRKESADPLTESEYRLAEQLLRLHGISMPDESQENCSPIDGV